MRRGGTRTWVPLLVLDRVPRLDPNATRPRARMESARRRPGHGATSPRGETPGDWWQDPRPGAIARVSLPERCRARHHRADDGPPQAE